MFLSFLILGRFQKLGMKLNDFFWDDIVERVESIQKLSIVNWKVVIKCVKVLLDFIERKLKFSENDLLYVVLNCLLGVFFLLIL